MRPQSLGKTQDLRHIAPLCRTRPLLKPFHHHVHRACIVGVLELLRQQIGDGQFSIGEKKRPELSDEVSCCSRRRAFPSRKARSPRWAHAGGHGHACWFLSGQLNVIWIPFPFSIPIFYY